MWGGTPRPHTIVREEVKPYTATDSKQHIHRSHHIIAEYIIQSLNNGDFSVQVLLAISSSIAISHPYVPLF